MGDRGGGGGVGLNRERGRGGLLQNLTSKRRFIRKGRGLIERGRLLQNFKWGGGC